MDGILITTMTELLVDKASVHAGGPLILLLPAGRPFVFLPLVDNASETAGELSYFVQLCYTSQLTSFGLSYIF